MLFTIWSYILLLPLWAQNFVAPFADRIHFVEELTKPAIYDAQDLHDGAIGRTYYEQGISWVEIEVSALNNTEMTLQYIVHEVAGHLHGKGECEAYTLQEALAWSAGQSGQAKERARWLFKTFGELDCKERFPDYVPIGSY